MIYLLYLFFGFAPSVIWLLFFLRKDVHPESKRMILKIFLYGMLIALPALFIEIGFSETSLNIPLPEIGILILNIFIGVALVEEFLKYLVVREKVLKDPELDEPTDLVLYMIIAALGFAAVENIFVLFSPKEPLLIQEASFIIAFRFLGATFLHALTSGTIGYFLARYFFTAKRKFFIFGFILATFLHGLFNSFIIMVDKGVIQEWLGFFLVSLILIPLAFFVNLSFRKLKNLPSVTKVSDYFNI